MQPIRENDRAERRPTSLSRPTKKILLIGGANNAAFLERLKTYRLFRCDTVLQAWSLVYRQRPHLIVLDLGSSPSGELSVLRECRALAGRVPVLVVAPDHPTEALAAALKHLATAVIPAAAVAVSVGEALKNLV